MFESSVVPAAPRGRSGWTLSLSTAFQVALVAGAVIFPLLKVEALPAVRLIPRPPAPRFRAVEVVAASRAANVSSAPRLVQPKVFVAPSRIPNRPAATIVDDPGSLPAYSAQNSGPGVPTGSPVGFGDIVNAPPQIAPPPAKAPVVVTKPAERPKPVVVGGNVRPPKLIREVKPGYPQLARQARVQGLVRLNAVLDRTGRVQALSVTSGHPLLIQAALDAVRQWLYEPTLLNGQPVEVIMVVDVNFALSQ